MQLLVEVLLVDVALQVHQRQTPERACGTQLLRRLPSRLRGAEYGSLATASR